MRCRHRHRNDRRIGQVRNTLQDLFDFGWGHFGLRVHFKRHAGKPDSLSSRGSTLKRSGPPRSRHRPLARYGASHSSASSRHIERHAIAKRVLSNITWCRLKNDIANATGFFELAGPRRQQNFGNRLGVTLVSGFSIFGWRPPGWIAKSNVEKSLSEPQRFNKSRPEGIAGRYGTSTTWAPYSNFVRASYDKQQTTAVKHKCRINIRCPTLL